MKKIKWVGGSVTMQLHEVERRFLLSYAKLLKPKTELEKRIVHRFLKSLTNTRGYYPLYPMQECPHCQRNYRGNILERHKISCQRKIEENRKTTYEIDPVVWEMMQ